MSRMKYVSILLIISLVLLLGGCGEKKATSEVPAAVPGVPDGSGVFSNTAGEKIYLGMDSAACGKIMDAEFEDGWSTTTDEPVQILALDGKIASIGCVGKASWTMGGVACGGSIDNAHARLGEPDKTIPASIRTQGLRVDCYGTGDGGEFILQYGEDGVIKSVSAGIMLSEELPPIQGVARYASGTGDAHRDRFPFQGAELTIRHTGKGPFLVTASDGQGAEKVLAQSDGDCNVTLTAPDYANPSLNVQATGDWRIAVKYYSGR